MSLIQYRQTVANYFRHNAHKTSCPVTLSREGKLVPVQNKFLGGLYSLQETSVVYSLWMTSPNKKLSLKALEKHVGERWV